MTHRTFIPAILALASAVAMGAVLGDVLSGGFGAPIKALALLVPLAAIACLSARIPRQFPSRKSSPISE
ncbi:hypothetical protein [Shimia biformata]|uniref:hypothetical protein n=1 Tax=Shimia biformata TaxID=1294299 RepID=UPI0019521D7D|nr:hypothetical protein [Shimia biformata]